MLYFCTEGNIQFTTYLEVPVLAAAAATDLVTVFFEVLETAFSFTTYECEEKIKLVLSKTVGKN